MSDITHFQYDVFLSHSQKDKAVARDVAERLKEDGLRVWFDEWEIKPGDNIPAKIEEELDTVVGLLAGTGMIQRLDFGGFILLRHEVISRYAAAVVRKVRKHPQELGCIRKDEVLAGELDYQVCLHGRWRGNPAPARDTIFFATGNPPLRPSQERNTGGIVILFFLLLQFHKPTIKELSWKRSLFQQKTRPLRLGRILRRLRWVVLFLYRGRYLLYQRRGNCCSVI